MFSQKGVQAEVLLSLALVMVTGTALLAAVFLELSSARVAALHELLGRGFVAASQESVFELNPVSDGRWWRVDASGRTRGLNASAGEIDRETLALAQEALESREPVVLSGAPWQPIRFAGPQPTGEGAYGGRIDAPVSGFVLAVLVVTDVLIFGLFGVTLLRRRVVGPLHRLARGVWELGESDGAAEVPVEGAAEIEALGTAFNEMQAALRARTGALEKAVVDLRSANATLLQAREGLDRAERLAMVGSLAAGVAHEVGNPMAALLAFLDVAQRDEGLSDDGRSCLRKASEQGERVRVILRQLLDFSRPPQVSHGPIDLGAIARQAAELVTAQKQYADIDFEVVVAPGTGAALGDASLASQILLNLAINAASACDSACATDATSGDTSARAEGASGTDASTSPGDLVSERRQRCVRIEVERGVLTPRAEEPEVALPEARLDAVRVLVSDSGSGVTLEDPERIFDPFFTTKAPGEGTGLGLANARRLAQEMGGDVVLEAPVTALGGACFGFRLASAEASGHPGTGVRGEASNQSRRP